MKKLKSRKIVLIWFTALAALILYVSLKSNAGKKSGSAQDKQTTDQTSNTDDQNNTNGGNPSTPAPTPAPEKTAVTFSDLNSSSKFAPMGSYLNVRTTVKPLKAKVVLKATKDGVEKTFDPTSVGELGDVSWDFKLDSTGEWTLQAVGTGDFSGSSNTVKINIT